VETSRFGNWSIWFFAFGYFACYVPYSALTKALSKGEMPGMNGGLGGAILLPVSTMASVVGMFAFIFAMRWWSFATPWQIGGITLRRPTRWTFLSGLCTAAIIATTTLAYTFDGVSIVFVMLLMRGGVLILAPIVDAVTGRKTRWFSWLGLGLSLAALIVAFAENGDLVDLFVRPQKFIAALPMLLLADVAVYLGAYFVRLRFMTRLAKSDKDADTKRFFVEEQMVASPAIVLFLLAGSFIWSNEFWTEVSHGFTTFWGSEHLGTTIVIGLMSQGTGIFGGLVLLDKRENTFSVPVNRASSILAGVAATLLLAAMLGSDLPSGFEFAGAALVICAILALSIPPIVEKRRRAQR
jgi:drug/metabolite transporter (DMT)-like permease